ncbi:MAG: glycosyltransferase [Lachnospiraceae bacterium]|nr:glycosyltransferase [Lachnospiraceae bacterium]
MNRYPLVSVIVPIYNVEQYVHNTIESIRNQRYGMLEIILVNDGSTDRSGEIAESMSRIDDRIILISQANRGVSFARNAGIEASSGEYIMFVDGDDYVETDYVSNFVKIIKSGRYDLAVSDTYYREEHPCNDVRGKKTGLYDIYDNERVIEMIYLNRIFMAVWNKIYKREFLQHNNIRFDQDIWYGEGMLFNIKCLTKTQMVPCGHSLLYHYVNNPNSAMRKYNLRNELCGIRSIYRQKVFLRKDNLRLAHAVEYHIWGVLFGVLCYITRENKKRINTNLYRYCYMFSKRHIFTPLFVDIGLKEKIYLICVGLSPKGMVYIKNLKRRIVNKELNRRSNA